MKFAKYSAAARSGELSATAGNSCSARNALVCSTMRRAASRAVAAAVDDGESPPAGDLAWGLASGGACPVAVQVATMISPHPSIPPNANRMNDDMCAPLWEISLQKKLVQNLRRTNLQTIARLDHWSYC